MVFTFQIRRNYDCYLKTEYVKFHYSVRNLDGWNQINQQFYEIVKRFQKSAYYKYCPKNKTLSALSHQRSEVNCKKLSIKK